MSRTYQRPAGARAGPNETARVPGRSPQRPNPSGSSTRGGPRGGPAMRGTARPAPTHAPRATAGTSTTVPPENPRSSQPERTVHVGDGFQIFTPSNAKREQMLRQAEKEQREYQQHVESTRPRGLHEVHQLGGGTLTEEQVRQRQAENYRRERFARQERSQQEQLQRKAQEEREIEEKKQAARNQALKNASREREKQLHSMRMTTDTGATGATGWTDEDRERDRRATMNRFLDRFSKPPSETAVNLDNHEQSVDGQAYDDEDLKTLCEMFPHLDVQTLRSYLESNEGNIDFAVQALTE